MPETLCWKCKNTNRFKCSWFKDFTPVHGWTAKHTVRHYTYTHYRHDGDKLVAYKTEHNIESYHVIKCPNFDPEHQRELTETVSAPMEKKTNGTCNQRAMMQKAREKPENPFRKGTKIHRMYEGDWKDKDTEEVASELNMTRKGVRCAIYKIKERTGYDVQIKLDAEQSRRSRQGAR